MYRKSVICFISFYMNELWCRVEKYINITIKRRPTQYIFHSNIIYDFYYIYEMYKLCSGVSHKYCVY